MPWERSERVPRDVCVLQGRIGAFGPRARATYLPPSRTADRPSFRDPDDDPPLLHALRRIRYAGQQRGAPLAMRATCEAEPAEPGRARCHLHGNQDAAWRPAQARNKVASPLRNFTLSVMTYVGSPRDSDLVARGGIDRG